MTATRGGGTPGQTSRRGAWVAAASLFTLIPVRAPAEIEPGQMPGVIARLPVIGGLLGAAAGAVLLGVEATGAGPVHRLLGAALAVAVLAIATGGLHLDGLADTADGLGSRRPGNRALEIMRRPDTGPMGVIALILTIGLQVTALAAAPAGAPAVLGLVAAAITGRTAVVLATGPAFPAARPDGIGSLVAGMTSGRTRIAAAGFLLGGALTVGALTAGPGLALWLTVAVLAGLVTGHAVARAARTVLGGLTGDVYGAIIELSTLAVLLVLALAGR
ncbi:MAG: adenosylcobinamide-GDP ribazoletransferase [Actinomycetota bacterium]|nr:adenosylcobinamide-GDP ribazoletransferase [Actinomycetota bacterium]